jgi:hypothetical protein
VAAVPREEAGRLSRRASRFLRDNGLSLTLLALFVLFLGAQALVGVHEFNQARLEHGEAPLQLAAYLASGHFIAATAENWESEFLQMAAYVLLTVSLFQKGSSESKKPGGEEPVDLDPRNVRGKVLADAPWPVRRGGWVLKFYEHSLSIAFLLLFAGAFGAHAVGGARAYSEEQVAHGGEPVSVEEYVQTSRFWFESFQNWQSEFLAIAAMVLLSIHLRQRGSPESKPVHAPHSHTGSG